MNTPILTVAIPTYNRPEPLRQILDVLKNVDNKLFFVLISDDSSTEGVRSLIDGYRGLMPNLRYNRNSKNLGFSGNVCKLYELAQTRYIWFLCDDDTVYPDAVIEIIGALKKHEPAVAIFNSTWVDSYGRKLVTGGQDRSYTDFQSLGDYSVLMRLTFLSIIVVEKRLPIEVITRVPEYKDNVFVQLTLGLCLLSDKFKLCEFSSAIVHRNVGFKYGEFFKFNLLDPLKAVYLVPHNFDNEQFLRWTKGNLPNTVQLYLSQKIGLFVFKGKPTEATLGLLKHFFGKRYMAGFLLSRAVLALIPAFLLRFMYLIRLVRFHGFTNGLITYKQMADRATKDERETGFTAYR